MRLSNEERNAICAVLRRADPNGKVILFGSRTDDARRGGDIDIYFETEKRLTLDDEIRLDIEIEDACDTKVDLLIKFVGTHTEYDQIDAATVEME